MKRAIVLCSGGLDSVVTAYYAKNRMKYSEGIILFFNYGQRSLLQERKCARLCSKRLNFSFIELNVQELGRLSPSLLNVKNRVRKIKRKDLHDTSKESSKWYVPLRNTVFISYGLALAESLYLKDGKKSDLFVGFKCEGKDSYPDTTEKYIQTINELSKVASMGFSVYAPLIKKDKEDIIVLGKKLGVNFKETMSCYNSDGTHCGSCLACMLRKEGFYWANIKDPTFYEDKKID